MTGLLRLLGVILGQHIERDDLPPADLAWPDELAEFPITVASPGPCHPAGTPEAHFRTHPQTAGSSDDGTTSRPCWACGNPVGFRTFHLPCWNVPPFKLTSPTLPNGSQPRRTT